MLQRCRLITPVALAAGALDARRATQAERTAPAVSAGSSQDESAPLRPESRAPRNQIEEYRAQRNKPILELQQFRRTTRLTVAGLGGNLSTVDLVDLNPRIGAWYLLQLETSDGTQAAYHLELSGSA